MNFIIIIIISSIIFKKVGSARLRESDIHPISQKTRRPRMSIILAAILSAGKPSHVYYDNSCHRVQVKAKSSMARSLPVDNLLPQNVGSIINFLQ